MPVLLSFEQILQLGHNSLTTMPEMAFLPQRPSQRALNQSLDQLLLHPMCCLCIYDSFRSNFGGTNGRRMESEETSVCRQRGMPLLRGRRHGECAFSQPMEMSSQLLRREPDGTPMARLLGPHMCTVTRAECHELTFLRSHST